MLAQDDGGAYAAALAELRAGRKRGHWIWFVFPHLREAAVAVHNHLVGQGVSLRHLMASQIDALKLFSSMTPRAVMWMSDTPITYQRVESVRWETPSAR